MGNKLSAVNGVRSPNFFEPGNGANEVWVGDVEVISRLPFGDSDMAQAAWPKGEFPKIPWRPFIIPLRATVDQAKRSMSALDPEKPPWWSQAISCMALIQAVDVICTLAAAIVSAVSMLTAIALYVAPNFLSHLLDIGPSIRDIELDGAFRPQYRNQPVRLRATLAQIFMLQGCAMLAAATAIQERTDGYLVSGGPIDWFYFLLMGYGSYCALRLLWASHKLGTDDIEEWEPVRDNCGQDSMQGDDNLSFSSVSSL